MSQNRKAEILFSGFTKLSDGQYWYRPSQPEGAIESSEAPSTIPTVEPDLIIFCSWAAALPKHVTKYLVPYQALYPHSDILLLESRLKNVAWVSDRVQMRNLRPAVNAINDILQAIPPKGGTGVKASTQAAGREPIILAHAFSNGGAHTIVQLAQAYREHMITIAPVTSQLHPRPPAKLPVSALILDSSPGRADYKIGIQVILSMMPKASILWRFFVTVLAHVLITSIVTAHKLGIAENIASKLWRCLNDLDGPFLLKKGASSTHTEDGSGLREEVKVVPRTYIYSNRDKLIPWQGVVDHADEARKAAAGALSKGTAENSGLWDAIQLEGFPGSAHVTHATVDRERYWRLVRETLERSCKGST